MTAEPSFDSRPNGMLALGLKEVAIKTEPAGDLWEPGWLTCVAWVYQMLGPLMHIRGPPTLITLGCDPEADRAAAMAASQKSLTRGVQIWQLKDHPPLCECSKRFLEDFDSFGVCHQFTDTFWKTACVCCKGNLCTSMVD